MFPLTRSSLLWQKDKSFSHCNICLKQFKRSAFKSGKHHCRKCGRIICNNCSKYTYKKHRICSECNSTTQADYKLGLIHCFLPNSNTINTKQMENVEYNLWSPKQTFNTANVAFTPCFSAQNNKIYYTTYMHYSHSSGIYSYDLGTNKHECVQSYDGMTNSEYFPEYHTSCFCESEQIMYFVGGERPHDGLMAYDIQKDSIETYNFEKHIGSNAAMIYAKQCFPNKLVFGFVHSIEYKNKLFVPTAVINVIELYTCVKYVGLHILGGEFSNEHLYWNGNSGEYEVIHSFKEYKMGIRGQAVIFNEKTGKMYMLGGCTERNTNTLHYNDFWCFDVVWTKKLNWELPNAMCGCGCVLYDNRIIITFGGRTRFTSRYDDTYRLDSIHYLDISEPKGRWIQSTVKCQFKGCCNAVLVKDETLVHILPFGNYVEHVMISVSMILPATLLNKNHRNNLLM